MFPFSALEDALDSHPSHPCLAATYNPPILSRSSALHRDVAFLLNDPKWDTSAKGIEVLNKVDVNTEVGTYVERLKQLGASNDRWTVEDSQHVDSNEMERSKKPFLLLAHSYTRYLGDLSGGQTMRRSVIKAYIRPSAAAAMEEDATLQAPSLLESQQGAEFYEFSALDKPDKLADPGEVKKLKAWFREGLDEAGEHLSESEKGEMRYFLFAPPLLQPKYSFFFIMFPFPVALIGEALFAFDLNFEFFAILSPSKPTGPMPSAPMEQQHDLSKKISTFQRITQSKLLPIFAILMAVIASWILT